jgi:hypothetical protein
MPFSSKEVDCVVNVERYGRGGICELRAGASKWEECRIVFDIQVVIFGTANSNSEFHPNANIQTQCYYLRFV